MKAIKQVLTLHEGWYDVPDGQEYTGAVLESRTVYIAQPAQPANHFAYASNMVAAHRSERERMLECVIADLTRECRELRGGGAQP